MNYGKFVVTGNLDFSEGISIEIPKQELVFNVVEPFDVEEELKGAS